LGLGSFRRGRRAVSSRHRPATCRMVVPAAGAPARRVPLFAGLPVVGPSIWPYSTYVIMHVLASTGGITERWWGALAPDRERRCRPRWLPGVGCAGDEA
jgi:hypothetical protein